MKTGDRWSTDILRCVPMPYMCDCYNKHVCYRLYTPTIVVVRGVRYVWL